MENPPNIGDRVRFLEGTFQGMEGNVIAVNVEERYAELEVNIWGRIVRASGTFDVLELVTRGN
jgi:transcription antitermination factor NusG